MAIDELRLPILGLMHPSQNYPVIQKEDVGRLKNLLIIYTLLLIYSDALSDQEILRYIPIASGLRSE